MENRSIKRSSDFRSLARSLTSYYCFHERPATASTRHHFCSLTNRLSTTPTTRTSIAIDHCRRRRRRRRRVDQTRVIQSAPIDDPPLLLRQSNHTYNTTMLLSILLFLLLLLYCYLLLFWLSSILKPVGIENWSLSSASLLALFVYIVQNFIY